MKKIITALNNPELNEKLKKEKNIKIINKDIIYKEGILEVLEIKQEIDFIIINYDLPGKITTENLIQKIKKINQKIEMIFILEKENPEKEKILKKYEVKNYYYNNKIDIEKIIEIIQEKSKKSEKELEDEIIRLKKIIEDETKNHKVHNHKTEKKCLQKIKKSIQNSKHKTKKIPNSILIEEREQEPKSHLALDIIKSNMREKKKILVVDLKIRNEDLHIAFHKANIYNQIENKNFIIHINKNIKLMTGLSKKIKNDYEKGIKKIIWIIEKNARRYDKIIIEILENNYSEINEKIIKKVEKNIFIFSNKIQDIKIVKQKIDKYKKLRNIYLFFNEEKENKIDFEILKEIFKKAKIIKNKQKLLKI